MEEVIDFSNIDDVKQFFSEDSKEVLEVLPENTKAGSVETKVSAIEKNTSKVIPTREKMMATTARVLDLKLSGAEDTQVLIAALRSTLYQKIMDNPESLTPSFLVEALKSLEQSHDSSLTTLKSFMNPTPTKDGNQDSTINIIFNQEPNSVAPGTFSQVSTDTSSLKYLNNLKEATDIVVGDE